MSDPSLIHDLQPDPPVDLSGPYQPSKHDRRFLDNQIQDTTKHLFDSCVLEVQCGWYFIDANQPSLVPLAIGDVVCGVPTSLDGKHVTKAVPGALAVSGAVTGVVMFGGAPGGYARIARLGIVSHTVTGLGVGAVSYVRVSNTGRLERVGSIGGSDFAVGTCDTAGNLTIHTVTSGGGGSITSLSGQVTGLISATVVEQLHGATVPIAGALTPGNSLLVSGPSALAYGAVNLAGGAASVTGNLPITNIAPGADQQFLRTIGSTVTWSTVAIGTGSIAPGTNGQVLTTDVTPATVWAKIVDNNIATGAAVAVAKLAHGTDGDFLGTVGTATQWVSTIPFGKIGHGAASTVLTTDAGATVSQWAKIVDANVDPAAGIVVSKLGHGTDGQVVVTSGTTVVWGTVTAGGIAPGTIGQVLTTGAGPATVWAQIADANVATGAAVAVAKLAGGSSGQFLVTIGSTPTWTSVSVGTGSIAPGVDGQWLVTIGGGSPVTAWETVANAGGNDWDGPYSATKVRGISGNAGVVAMHGTTLLWDTTVVPTLKGADVTANSATAPTFTVQAPNATGTGATGGTLNLTSGTGTLANGPLNLQVAGVTVVSLTTSTKVTLFGTATLTSGTAVPSAAEVDGSLYTRTGGANGSLWGRENAAWVRYLSLGTLPPSASTVQIVADMPALEALLVTPLADRCECIVQTPPRKYWLNKTGTPNASGDDDLPPANGGGRWEFKEAA